MVKKSIAKLPISNQQLREVMRFHLGNFNDEKVEISDKTKHNDVLSDSDGYGAANSKAIYKAALRWTFRRTTLGDPDWPKEWMPMTVADLADSFIPTKQ